MIIVAFVFAFLLMFIVGIATDSDALFYMAFVVIIIIIAFCMVAALAEITV